MVKETEGATKEGWETNAEHCTNITGNGGINHTILKAEDGLIDEATNQTVLDVLLQT